MIVLPQNFVHFIQNCLCFYVLRTTLSPPPCLAFKPQTFYFYTSPFLLFIVLKFSPSLPTSLLEKLPCNFGSN